MSRLSEQDGRTKLNQGPVVQSIVSLTSLLSGQLVKVFYYFITKYTDIFFLKNERSFCHAKPFHIFLNKKYKHTLDINV